MTAALARVIWTAPVHPALPCTPPENSMPAPLSHDLRTRIVQAYADGEGTYEELAARFDTNRSTVNRYLRLQRETGSVAAKPTGGSESILTEDDVESIHFLLLAEPDLTLDQLRTKFIEDDGPPVCIMTLWRAIGRLGLTRKKSRSSTTGARMRTS